MSGALRTLESRPKTVRFATLTEEAGRPEALTLWSEPGQDKQFLRAVRAGRVVSVRQENVGTKKDAGVVGFLKGKHLTYFVFPRSIKQAEGTKVVGINYALMAPPRLRPAHARKHQEPENAVPSRPRQTAPSQKPKSRKLANKPAPPPKKWRVRMRLQATMELTEEIVAPSKRAARQAALEPIEITDWSRASVVKKVSRVTAA